MASGFLLTLPCFLLLALDLPRVSIIALSCVLGLGGSAVSTALWPAISVDLPDDVAGSEW